MSRGLTAAGLDRAFSAEGQVLDPIAPFFCLGRRPDDKQRFDDRADGALLRNNEQTRTGIAGRQALPKMVSHCVPIMRDQNPVLLGSEFEKHGIFAFSQPAFLTSRMSMAGSRASKPSMMSASRSSSARKRTVTLASIPFPRGRPRGGRTGRDSSGSVELPSVRVHARPRQCTR